MERWKTNLYTLWVTQVFSLMGFGLSIPFIPFFFKELGITETVQLNYYVGLSASIPAVAMVFAAPVWGVLSDRYGRKLMLVRAMLAAALLLLAMGFVGEIWQFLVLRGLQGVFTGTVTASMAFIAANTPDHKISYALGFITSSNFLGYSLGPFLGGILAEQFGYRFCFYLGSVVMTIGLLLMVVLVKENADSYGIGARKKEDALGSKRMITPFILSILVLYLLSRIYTTVFLPFIPLFVEETLGTMKGAATYTGIISGATSLATSFAAITLTQLGDRFDKLKLLRITVLMIFPVALLVLLTQQLLSFTILFALLYFFSGAVEPMLTSLASEKTQPSMRGTLFGLIGTTSSVGLMVSPMIGATASALAGPRSILWLIPVFVFLQWMLIEIIRTKRFDHNNRV